MSVDLVLNELSLATHADTVSDHLKTYKFGRFADRERRRDIRLRRGSPSNGLIQRVS
jgi:hypothetical protein